MVMYRRWSLDLPVKDQCDWRARFAKTLSTPHRGSAVGAKRTSMKIEARAATTKLNLKNLNLDLFPYCTNIWLLLNVNVFNLFPDTDKKEELKKNGSRNVIIFVYWPKKHHFTHPHKPRQGFQVLDTITPYVQLSASSKVRWQLDPLSIIDSIS